MTTNYHSILSFLSSNTFFIFENGFEPINAGYSLYFLNTDNGDGCYETII